jgi:hypothetical protein
MNPKKQDWKDKTCEKCEYVVEQWCRRFPLGIAVLWSETGEDKSQYKQACAEYHEDYCGFIA